MSVAGLSTVRPAPPVRPATAGFFRFLAVAMLASGFLRWGVVLGLDGGGGLEAMPEIRAAATGAFAVLDLVVAVGLWMVSRWAVVVWAAASLGEIVLAFAHDAFTPDLAVMARAALLAFAALVGLLALAMARRGGVRRPTLG